MLPTLRLLAQRLILVLAGLLAGLLGAELMLRLYPDRSVPSGLRGLHEARPDRLWLYGLRPGATGRLGVSGEVLYHINEDGFRGRRYARPKPEGVYRILALGDSVTFGYGVEESATFTARLEELLRGQSDAAVEVPNLGVGGYNPYNEATLLADAGRSWEPDLVLVQFCINDLNDPTLHFDGQTRLHLGMIPDAAFPDPTVRGRVWHPPLSLLRTCRGLRLCAFADDMLLAWSAPKLEREAHLKAITPKLDPNGSEWRWLEDLYAGMADRARAFGAEFAVVVFPYAAQMRGPSPPLPQRMLAEMGRRRGWITVDPLPEFRRAAQEGTKLFLDEWHPTPDGHRVAAEAILAALQRSGLLRGTLHKRSTAFPLVIPAEAGIPTLDTGFRRYDGPIGTTSSAKPVRGKQ